MSAALTHDCLFLTKNLAENKVILLRLAFFRKSCNSSLSSMEGIPYRKLFLYGIARVTSEKECNQPACLTSLSLVGALWYLMWKYLMFLLVIITVYLILIDIESDLSIWISFLSDFYKAPTDHRLIRHAGWLRSFSGRRSRISIQKQCSLRNVPSSSTIRLKTAMTHNCGQNRLWKTTNFVFLLYR